MEYAGENRGYVNYPGKSNRGALGNQAMLNSVIGNQTALREEGVIQRIKLNGTVLSREYMLNCLKKKGSNEGRIDLLSRLNIEQLSSFFEKMEKDESEFKEELDAENYIVKSFQDYLDQEPASKVKSEDKIPSTINLEITYIKQAAIDQINKKYSYKLIVEDIPLLVKPEILQSLKSADQIYLALDKLLDQDNQEKFENQRLTEKAVNPNLTKAEDTALNNQFKNEWKTNFYSILDRFIESHPGYLDDEDSNSVYVLIKDKVIKGIIESEAVLNSSTIELLETIVSKKKLDNPGLEIGEKKNYIEKNMKTIENTIKSHKKNYNYQYSDADYKIIFNQLLNDEDLFKLKTEPDFYLKIEEIMKTQQIIIPETFSQNLNRDNIYVTKLIVGDDEYDSITSFLNSKKEKIDQQIQNFLLKYPKFKNVLTFDDISEIFKKQNKLSYSDKNEIYSKYLYWIKISGKMEAPESTVELPNIISEDRNFNKLLDKGLSIWEDEHKDKSKTIDKSYLKSRLLKINNIELFDNAWDFYMAISDILSDPPQQDIDFKCRKRMSFIVQYVG